MASSFFLLDVDNDVDDDAAIGIDVEDEGTDVDMIVVFIVVLREEERRIINRELIEFKYFSYSVVA